MNRKMNATCCYSHVIYTKYNMYVNRPYTRAQHTYICVDCFTALSLIYKLNVYLKFRKRSAHEFHSDFHLPHSMVAMF